MRKIRVRLKERSYDIFIGSNILRSAAKFLRGLGNDAYIITNAYIKHKYGGQLAKGLSDRGFSAIFKTVADSEESKSLDSFSAVINDLARYDRQKQVFIIAFGGGVIGDLAGFIASVYRRGVPYVQIPTTLLSQIDSSIGGKTAIDLRAGKNLVGAFYQPKAVFSDTSLLASLPAKQVSSGLAEAIKYGLIKDPGIFVFLERRLKKNFKLLPADLERIVGSCSKIKADIVSRDEREERGLRTILNFGHTIGHALEAAGNYRGYNHGESVALGMLVACDISRSMGLLENTHHQRIEALIGLAGLPTRIQRLSLERIMSAHYKDKKFVGKTNKFVLISGIGKTKILQNIPLSMIEFCLRARFHP